MRIRLVDRKFEIDEKELSRLAIQEYTRIMKEQEDRGFITLDFGLFGVLDGFFGSKGSKEIPKCMACGSYEDYSGRCRYHSVIKIIGEDRQESNLCKKEDIPTRNLIERGDLDGCEVHV